VGPVLVLVLADLVLVLVLVALILVLVLVLVGPVLVNITGLLMEPFHQKFYIKVTHQNADVDISTRIVP